MTPSKKPIEFSLVAGGPFHSLLGYFGLLGPDRLPTWRTALVLAMLALVPPILLDIAQTWLIADYSGWGFFRDPTVYTRYLVAIFAMVITEGFADKRIAILLNQFLHTGLIEGPAREQFRALARRADRQASRPLIEGGLLFVALTWSCLSYYYVSTISNSGWEESSNSGDPHLSWAGSAAALLSNPLFLFLVFRWLWRFLVWTILMAQISRLPLRLAAIHPDRVGGLGFMSIFPGVFIGFVFGLSCVISSSLLKSINLVPASQEFIWLVICGWVLLMVLIFLAPLFVFTVPLARTRERAVIEYGKLAHVHHRLFHDAWFSKNSGTPDIVGSNDPSFAADLNAVIETALNMRIVPLDMTAVLQILIAAVAPFAVVVASQIPLMELLKWLIGAIA